MSEIEVAGAGVAATEGAVTAKERPWLFSLLIAPSAVVSNGVIQGGVLGYMLSQRGVSSGQASHMIAVASLPTMLYFLWSPMTDFLVKRRTWLLVGGLSAGALMAAAIHQKDLLSTSTMVLMLLSACCSQLVVSSCGGIMGTLHSERTRRTSGSFYQAGSLVFGALAAMVLIPISDTGRRDVLGLAAAAMTALPALFTFAAPKQESVGGEAVGETLRRMGREFVETFWRWDAVPYTLCMLFPMASGAATSLVTGIAKDYGVNGAHVAWMNGLGGALLMGGGSIAAALIPARSRAPVVYLTLGLVNAATLGAMWLGPERAATYYVSVTLYLFTIGAGYAFFTAVVLEFLGSSGMSGSGRYSIINSLGNVPVLYMIRLDGWGGDKWGARGLPATDCVVSAVGAGLLLAYFLRWGPRRRLVAEIR
jgi:MFS transporter, PAT family, beta-lactamase induction signal transducer AmpG